MTRYLLRRLLHSIFVIWGTLTVVFLVLRIIGDPARLMVPKTATYEHIEMLRHTLGLDKPLHTQYLLFLRDAVSGDFGRSFIYERPAMGLVLHFLPNTILLTLSAAILSVPIAIASGILSAVKQYSLLDNVATLLTVLGRCIPHFWLGLMLMIVLSVRLRWLPPSGHGRVTHIIMPALTLATGLAASVARLTRSSMLEVLRQEYIRTARAKGLGERQVLTVHALRNALIPVITVIGLNIADLFGGAITVEMVFAWPGVGWLLMVSLGEYDYPVIQAVICIMCIAFVFSNLLVDVLYTFLDPRIRYD